MKNIEELKEQYVFKHTKDWDEETKEMYSSNVEDDFITWHQGYIQAIKDLSDDVLPILEFTKGKLNSEAGIFQMSVCKLIDELNKAVKIKLKR